MNFYGGDSEFLHDDQMYDPKLNAVWYNNGYVDDQPSPLQSIEESWSPEPSNSMVMRPALKYSSPMVSMPYSRPSSNLSAMSMSSKQVAIRASSSKTSNTKMANYARNYREMKKNQLALSENRNHELSLENEQLRSDNATLQGSLTKLEREIRNLRRVLDQDTNIASIMSRINGRVASANEDTGDVGVCLHIGNGKISIEICETCCQYARNRRTQKGEEVKPELEGAQLFDDHCEGSSRFIR